MTIRISALPDRCLGCKICMLTCSWHLHKKYQPEEGAIRIEVDKKTYRCSITIDADRCTGCMLCVKNCPAEALRAEDELIKI